MVEISGENPLAGFSRGNYNFAPLSWFDIGHLADFSTLVVYPRLIPQRKLRLAMVQHTHTIQQSKTVQQKTSVAKAGEVEQKWFVVDATDCTLGRLASQIAMILMGKHRPEYTPHVDTGEYVVVINAEKVKMSGRKLEHRHYAWYNGYNRQKMESYGERLERKPTDLVHFAVKRMLPKKNTLARHMLAKLKVYAGTEHPHQAQQPIPASFGFQAVAAKANSQE
jgi:large subunit ribosomal protein L13